VAKSTLWYNLSEKKECTGELRNINRPGRPRRTTVVNDQRILSMVKKNHFTTSSQEKNILQETDVSTIKRRLHQSKHRGDDRRILSLSQHPAKRRTLSRRQTCLQSREDFTRANTEVMIGGSSLFHNIQPREEHSPGDRRVYNQEKTSPETSPQDQIRLYSGKPLLCTAEIQSTCSRMTGRKKYGDGLEQLMIEAYSIICETWSSVMHERASSDWLLCLVMMRRMKSEVYNRDILSAQIRSKQQS